MTAFDTAMRVRSPVRKTPDGITVFAFVTAVITSSGDIWYCRNLSGSNRTTMVRWLPPNGGGAETPGSVANKGLTRLMAMSCISAGSRVALEKTNCPMAIEPVSKRVINGGTAPGGMNDRERLA